MFQRGDHVVHHIHGAGTIVGLVHPDSAPKDCEYYELDLVASDTRLMVPVEGAEESLRPVSSSGTMDEALKAILQQLPNANVGRGRWRQRLRASLRTGQALAAAEVLQHLRARHQRRDLTRTDRRLLRKATAFLASEIAVVKKIPFEQAEYQVESLAMSCPS
ncbi:MAG: CarD family transcriptional regulator [Chloroflexota bacterium]|nr:CarD family transcriptional regulator [Chloroflexota bacterium]